VKISKKILNKALLFLMVTFTVGTLNASSEDLKRMIQIRLKKIQKRNYVEYGWQV